MKGPAVDKEPENEPVAADTDVVTASELPLRAPLAVIVVPFIIGAEMEFPAVMLFVTLRSVIGREEIVEYTGRDVGPVDVRIVPVAPGVIKFVVDGAV